jgi:uncharacterized membrane protein
VLNRKLPRANLQISPEASLPVPNPDHAWKALSLVNEWIRHSDAKAGVTLAFAGVLGATLFNLAKDNTTRSFAFDLFVVIGCASLLLTAGLCAWTLTPRIDDRDSGVESINRLFFASISRHFKGDRLGYAEVLTTLTSNPEELVKDLANQIHANATIATLKSAYAKWAIRSALLSGACVGAVALIIGINGL